MKLIRASADKPQAALPNPDQDESITIHVREELQVDPEIQEQADSAFAKIGPVTVREDLRGCHCLISEMREYLNGRDLYPTGIYRITQDAPLDLKVSKDGQHRALRIMDALIKALVARGLAVEVTERKVQGSGYYQYAERTEDSNVTRVQVDGEWVTFGMEQRSEVVFPDPPEPPKHLKGEKLESWIYWNQPRRTLVPNGVLVLKLKNVGYLRVRAEWKDGARKKLEDQLNDIVAHIYLAGEALKEKRRQDKQAALAQAERYKREHEEYLRRQEQERKAKVLSGWMEGWRLARDIRDFVAEALSLGRTRRGCLLGRSSMLMALILCRNCERARQRSTSRMRMTTTTSSCLLGTTTPVADNKNLPTSLQRTAHNGPAPAFRILWRNPLFAARKAASDAI